MDTLSIYGKNPISQDHIMRIQQIVTAGPVLITTHDNPDPDALASGVAIELLIRQKWGIATKLIYSGDVGRAENHAILKLLTPEWEHVDTWGDFSQFSSVIYVDCQPGSRNFLPVSENVATIVIDHHYPIVERTLKAAFSDIRTDIGSTTTMIYQYLDAAGISINPIVATAMFFGLRADTNGLSRGASLEDGIVYIKLLEQLDRKLLHKVETAGLAHEYYRAFYRGLQDARVYGKAIIADLGEIHRPDLAAELVDWLFRYEHVHMALCSGIYKQNIHFSIRTDMLDLDAGILVQNVIFPPGSAGGHGIMAGGQIPVNGGLPYELTKKLEQRFLESVGEQGKPRHLLRHDLLDLK